MIMKYLLFLGFLSISLKIFSAEIYDRDAVGELKNKIVKLAESFNHGGDPRFHKQNKLKPFIDQLVKISNQGPIAERMPLLKGVWKQVWGKYSFKDRLVDPQIGVDEIYQVIFLNGISYSIAPLYKNGDQTNKKGERIGILKATYRIQSNYNNVIRLDFKKYPGVKPRPTHTELWELAQLAENNQLENEIEIASSFIVKYVLDKIYLREVYTDQDLRIMYVARKKSFSDEHVHVMRRVSEQEFTLMDW